VSKQTRLRPAPVPLGSARVVLDMPLELHDSLRVVSAAVGLGQDAIMIAALRTALAQLSAESDALDDLCNPRRRGGFLADLARAVARRRAELVTRDEEVGRRKGGPRLQLLKGSSKKGSSK
jgi:hypothetical protein